MVKRMRKQNKRNSLSFLMENEGASIVLVTIISILIVTGVVILRITTSSLLASADKQLNQDKAYMMAVSLGDSIDKLISDDKITDPYVFNGFDDSANTEYAIHNSSVTVQVSEYKNVSDKYIVITVKSKVVDAEYEYKLTYLQVGSKYVRQY